MFAAFTYEDVMAALESDPRIREKHIEHDRESNQFVATIRGSDSSAKKLPKSQWIQGVGQADTQLVAWKRAYAQFAEGLNRERLKQANNE